MKILFICLAVVLPLVGCVPIPHHESYAPKLSGIIKSNGIPAQNVALRLSADNTKKLAYAHTDNSGRFVIGPLTELELFQGLIGDPGFFFKLEITTNGNEYVGYEENLFARYPEDTDLICDLDHINRIKGKEMYCTPNNTLRNTP